ncbi:MAG: hypothetical protein J6Y38_00285 [Bacteroidaceae bacterium]|nr:hypothetical protein [Bacteroidaceae bacterium]
MGQINLTSQLKRIAYKDANLYVTSPDIYSKIPSEMVINYASENSGIPKAQMASAFYALNQTVEQFLLNGHSIELMHLGYLYLSVSAKAVEDEEDAGAKAVKRVSIKFRQNKKLRNLINSNVQLVNELVKKSDESTDSSGSSSNNGDNGGNNSGDSGGGNSEPTPTPDDGGGFGG